jgi:hypothetical protein
VVPGLANFVVAQLSRFLPRGRVARVTERLMRPRTPPLLASSAGR